VLLPLFEHRPDGDLSDQVLAGHDLARRRLSIGADRHRVDLDAIELETAGTVLVSVGEDEAETHRVADAACGWLGDARGDQVQRRERRSLLAARRHDPAKSNQRQALARPAEHQRT
jgi:hypothetical protein